MDWFSCIKSVSSCFVHVTLGIIPVSKSETSHNLHSCHHRRIKTRVSISPYRFVLVRSSNFNLFTLHVLIHTLPEFHSREANTFPLECNIFERYCNTPAVNTKPDSIYTWVLRVTYLF